MADIEYVLSDVTRVIVVDDLGTHGFPAEKGSVWYDLQDEDRTLRIFLSSPKPPKPDHELLSEAIISVGNALTKTPVELKELVNAATVIRSLKTKVTEDASRTLLDGLSKTINKTAMTLMVRGR
jgi:hypothetical protein